MAQQGGKGGGARKIGTKRKKPAQQRYTSTRRADTNRERAIATRERKLARREKRRSYMQTVAVEAKAETRRRLRAMNAKERFHARGLGERQWAGNNPKHNERHGRDEKGQKIVFRNPPVAQAEPLHLV